MSTSSNVDVVVHQHLAGHRGVLYALNNPLFDAIQTQSFLYHMQQKLKALHSFLKPVHQSHVPWSGDQFLMQSLKLLGCDQDNDILMSQ